ncbi:protein DOG1-like 3 [Lactuca sativa]|uniref:protein DOG1-like 3 n=1 Tax=Lactuca sativa TaxID=4236 RepID=UPI000CD97286|nr:protein DOG1-like 3 [Lactuca sativa]
MSQLTKGKLHSQYLMTTSEETTHRQPFHKFFDCWLRELNTNLEQLVSAANLHHDDNHHHIEDDSGSFSLIDKTIGHYVEYYKAKSNGAKEDVLSMFMAPWLTTLEDSFLWIGGWRPTTAVHLLYSKSGIQLEARLAELVPELNCMDLGDLNSNQMKGIDELQKKIIREERVISEKMASVQESAADTPMVDLSNMESEMIRNNEDDGRKDSDEKVESELERKNDKLVEMLRMADGLRMETLKSVVEILTPLQAVYFLIAAAELHLRLHEWGQKKDAT